MRVLARNELVVLWTLIAVTAVGFLMAATIWFRGGFALFGAAGLFTCLVGWKFNFDKRR